MRSSFGVLVIALVVTAGCGGEKKATKPGASGMSAMASPGMTPARRADRRAASRRTVKRVAPRKRAPARAAAMPSAECRRKGRVTRLDLARLGRGSYWGRLGKVRQAVNRRRAAFLGDHGELQQVKGGFLAAWVKPHKGTMWRHPLVGEARRQGLRFTGKRRLALARGWEGTRILGTAVSDVDRDGRPEFLVWYRWESKPERAVGQHSIEYLAVVDLQGPRLQGLVELGRGGQASVHDKCTATLRRGDLRCDGKPSLYVTRRCKVICDDKPGDVSCTRTRWTTVEVRYDGPNDTYQAEQVFGRPPVKAADKGGGPWLVILSSIPDGLWDARVAADKQRDRFAKRGVKATVHHSGAFAKLTPGLWVVVAGRHADRKAAEAQLAALKKKRVKGYLKQGY